VEWTRLRARLRRATRELLRGLLDGLCPGHCPACGLPVPDAGMVCGPCHQRLEARCPPLCDRCGEPLLAAGAPCAVDHRRLRGISRARAPFRYRGTCAQVVHRLKFQHDPAAAELLGRAMADALRGWARRAEGRHAVLVAVPVHPSRRRRRGFDQAAELAEGVARRLGLVHRPRTLVRRRATLPQGDPRVTSRSANVRGAFVVRRPRRVRGRRVVLVDDVTTSGATARECARVLRAAGAAEVVLLTAARA
jgi:ComF family protein